MAMLTHYRRRKDKVPAEITSEEGREWYGAKLAERNLIEEDIKKIKKELYEFRQSKGLNY